jgi:hypothetical protein
MSDNSPDRSKAEILQLVDVLAAADPEMVAEVGGKHALALRFATEILVQGDRVRTLLPPVEAEALLLSVARTLSPEADDTDDLIAETEEETL